LDVVVAPDKFKGSLAAVEVASIVAAAIRRHSPSAKVTEHPVADGGEGTVALALAHGFSPVTIAVSGPLGLPVPATYAIRGTVAILETASAAGLGLLLGPPTVGTAHDATTFGVGELILDALARGATQVVVGAGGSASTDGGAGAVEALGVDVAALGRTPHQRGARRAGLLPRLAGVDLVVACDVDNPLLGPSGAATVYAPQKGADESLVTELEQQLTDWADHVTTLTGRDVRTLPGAGAAGGLAYGLVALAGARVVSGLRTMAQLTGLDAAVETADLVVIGEGSLDSQSLRGKGPIGVARMAAHHDCTVVAVTGRNLLTEADALAAGLAAVYSLQDDEPDRDVCMRDAARLLEAAAEHLARDWVPVLATRSGSRSVGHAAAEPAPSTVR
jgi:glycerate kinase